MDAAIARAIRFARNKNYSLAIKNLDAEVLSYRDSWLYTYVLGLCYLKSGDAGSAYGLLRRAAEIDGKKPEPFCALAALHIRRGENAKAVSLYLRVKDIEPNNALARRGLKLIQKHADRDSAELSYDDFAAKLYPRFPAVPLSGKTIMLAAGFAVLFALCAGGASLYKRGFLRFPEIKKQEREGLSVSALSGDEKKAPAEAPALTGSVRYVLTAKEILDGYEKGRDFFNKRRDDAARVEFNRILESNAAPSLKNKARLLISYMETPDFTNLTEHFSFKDIALEPFLYKDCVVLWRGMAANVQAGDTETVFDFLAGYDTRQQLEGTVRVRFDYAVRVNAEKALEVLASVVPYQSGGNPPFELKGLSIHEIN